MKRTISGAALVVIFILLIAMSSRNTIRSTSSGLIHIGAIIPLTGPMASLGDEMRKGYEWKIEELRLLGKNITFTVEDSKSDTQDSLIAWKKLVDNDKTPIVFTTISDTAISLKPLAESKTVLLWADAAHPELTENSKFILRHSNVAKKDAEVIGDQIVTLKKKKTGILYQNDAWGELTSKLLAEKLAHNEIIAVSESVDIKNVDFTANVRKMLSQRIDSLVVVTTGASAGFIIKQARELGFRGDIVTSIGIFMNKVAMQVALPYLKGVYYQTYVDNNAFTNDYKARFNSEPESFVHVAYTDMELLFNAIEQTGTVDPVQISRYIKGMGSFKGKYEQVYISAEGDITIPTVVKKW